jgi:hypothetical protein
MRKYKPEVIHRHPIFKKFLKEEMDACGGIGVPDDAWKSYFVFSGYMGAIGTYLKTHPTATLSEFISGLAGVARYGKYIPTAGALATASGTVLSEVGFVAGVWGLMAYAGCILGSYLVALKRFYKALSIYNGQTIWKEVFGPWAPYIAPFGYFHRAVRDPVNKNKKLRKITLKAGGIINYAN